MPYRSRCSRKPRGTAGIQRGGSRLCAEVPAEKDSLAVDAVTSERVSPSKVPIETGSHDYLAVAVCRDPVSGRSSLFHRENTGNFLGFSAFRGRVPHEIAMGIANVAGALA